MSELDFIRDFKLKLLDFICEDDSEDAIRLIRKHDKNLEKGEFSFPTTSNQKVWSKFRLKNMNLDKIPNILPIIKSCKQVGDVIIVHLNRKLVSIEHFNLQSSTTNLKNTNSRIINFDETKPNTSEITSARCQSLCQSLAKLPLKDDSLFCVSSTNLPTQIQNFKVEKNNLEQCVGIRVGPVVAANDKKETELSWDNYKEAVLEEMRTLDEERRDEAEEDVVTETRLGVLTSASIQFTFLGSNISNPVRIQFNNQNSSFVLYNLARMKQILRTFDQCVARNEYPPLPSSQNINFELLSEPEEWEMMFNFVLNYQNVIQECCRTLSLHKLVISLCSFVSCFSRYYNRVKILKDPLPHLVPTVHAKIYFIKTISEVTIKALDILNISYISKM